MMNPNSRVFVIAAVLILGVAITEYVRVNKMISIREHEKELEKVLVDADAKVKEAESRYRLAVGEEIHRREMRQLFEKATSRADDANNRRGLALRKMAAFDSEFSGVNWDGFNELLSAGLNAEKREAVQEKEKKDRDQIREKGDLLVKEYSKAESELSDALADLRYAKTELERLGVNVELP